MRQLLFLCCIIWVHWGTAQVRQLPEVVSTSFRNKTAAVGKKTSTIDSAWTRLYQGRNLAELLNDMSTASIRSYGINGSASISLRGTGADQTAVLWNGIPLQSPSHGQFDFSNLPVFFLDHIAIQAGPSTADQGSQSLGGAIILKTGDQLPSTSGLTAKASLQTGSWKQQQLGLGLRYTGKSLRWSHQLRVYLQKAANDYPITRFLIASENNYFKLKTPYRQSNADFLQEGFMTSSQYLGKNGGQWLSTLAAVKTRRSLVNISQAAQADDNLYASTQFAKSIGAYQLKGAVGFTREQLLYTNVAANIRSQSLSNQWWLHASADRSIHTHWNIQLQPQLQYLSSRIDGYGGVQPRQWRSSLASSLRYIPASGPFSAEGTLRVQSTPLFGTQLLPSFGASWKINPRYQIKTQVGRIYHIPDFNDLYWAVGGNPNLTPEQGTGGEWGIVRSFDRGAIEITAFANRLKQAIMWLPGPLFWSPVNLPGTSSEGIEWQSNYRWNWQQWQWTAAFDYTHTRSRGYTGDREMAEKQLIYVPRDKAVGKLTLAYRQWALNLSSQYQSRRFTSTTNQTWLPAFATANARISRDLKLIKQHWLLFVEVQNASNAFYMSQPGFTMPGRTFLIGLHLN
ncbi:MAG TPA: TonB-dependent receptor [Luteibaculaceae bacterium]|nr:TonB-dependent receptor [Luteibaculaceae bacterium]